MVYFNHKHRENKTDLCFNVMHGLYNVIKDKSLKG